MIRRLLGAKEGPRSVWSAIGLIGSTLLLLPAVALAARKLGTENYGVYAGIGALVNLGATFGGLGTKEMLLKRVTAKREDLPAAWGVLLAANVVAGLPVLAITIGVAALLLQGRDLTAIALLAVAEYLSASLVKGPAVTWVAIDRFSRVAAANIFDALLRLLATLWLVVGEADVRRLAMALAVLMAGGAVATNLAVLRDAGRPTLVWAELTDSCRKGVPFSVAALSGAVQSNIDQFMLVRARLDLDAGLYAAGVRFISYSMLPLHAMLSGSIPEFYRLGNESPAESLRYGRRLLPRFVAISLLGAIAAVVFARPAGALLGDRFDGILPVVAALVLLPGIRMTQNMVSSALLGSGHQGVVARNQMITAALNIAINLVLIPMWGWKGAVAATYVSELVYLGLLEREGRRHLAGAPGTAPASPVS